MKTLIEKLSASLKEDRSDANRKKWAVNIIENKIELVNLITLIHAEYPIAIRFSWLLGFICELTPTIVYPSITYLFSERDKIYIPNFNRSLAKMFYLCGIPEAIEGIAIDELFRWLNDAKSNVTTKEFSSLALQKHTAKHPELKNELKLILEEQCAKNTPTFEKKARKILENL